jgi:hypothetical protein
MDSDKELWQRRAIFQVRHSATAIFGGSIVGLFVIGGTAARYTDTQPTWSATTILATSIAWGIAAAAIWAALIAPYQQRDQAREAWDSLQREVERLNAQLQEVRHLTPEGVAELVAQAEAGNAQRHREMSPNEMLSLDSAIDGMLTVIRTRRETQDPTEHPIGVIMAVGSPLEAITQSAQQLYRELPPSAFHMADASTAEGPVEILDLYQSFYEEWQARLDEHFLALPPEQRPERLRGA